MPKPKKPDFWRDVMMVACGCVIGMALDVELTEFLPDDPGVAVSAVVLSAALATLGTISALRWRS